MCWTFPSSHFQCLRPWAAKCNESYETTTTIPEIDAAIMTSSTGSDWHWLLLLFSGLMAPQQIVSQLQTGYDLLNTSFEAFTSINLKCNPILSSKEGLFRKSTSPLYHSSDSVHPKTSTLYVCQGEKQSFPCPAHRRQEIGPVVHTREADLDLILLLDFRENKGVSSSRYTKIYSDCAVRHSRCKHRCSI